MSSQPKEYDIIIVGAGPAGSAAAIHLANLEPGLAHRTLILEKETFPRVKLCGGGVTQHAFDLLRQLRVQMDVPSFPVHAMRVRFEELEFTFRRRNVFRVVRREEFDAALARFAQSRGIRLNESECLSDLSRDETGFVVKTDRDRYHAKLLIGADGAKSVVRSKVGLARQGRISRLLEVLTPVDGPSPSEVLDNSALFDFTVMNAGVQGYYWDFPSLVRGEPTVNRGLFDSRVRSERPPSDLKSVFQEKLLERGINLTDLRLMGHPERWFDPRDRHAAERVVLAGDAAGAEPWLGEGISHALNFGIVAAEAAVGALASGDYSFSNYGRRIASSGLGRRLALKRLIARVYYDRCARWQYRLAWRLAALGFAIL